MTRHHPDAGRRVALLRPAARRVTALGCVALAVAGCSSSPAHDPSASDVVSSLGAVPIPSGGPADPTPTAAPGHPAVLAIGGPVSVTLPGSVRLLATALGPAQTATPHPTAGARPPQSTRAVITLRLVVTRGTVTASTDELSSRDQTGRAVVLTPQGPDRASATSGGPATLRVVGTFHSGAAQVTWRHDDHVLAVWTFNIELD